MRLLFGLLSNLLLFLTLPLFLLTLALWLQSYSSHHPLLSLESPPRLYEARTEPGHLVLAITRNWPGLAMLGISHFSDLSATTPIHSFAGLSYYRAPAHIAQIYSPTAQDLGVITGGGSYVLAPSRPNPLSTLTLFIPFWHVALLTGLFPALILAIRTRRAARLYLRRHRQQKGLCPTCAYDLRGSTDRCPECGNAIQPHPRT